MEKAKETDLGKAMERVKAMVMATSMGSVFLKS
jgi:hypothetical protein